MDIRSFDRIVIGAGSAGCVLAARLSEDPDCRVALIEAGGEADPRLAPVPGGAAQMRNTRADWGFVTVPQAHLFDRRIAYPRGRVIGGTSILNYMAYVRGNAGDFDLWAQMGNPGWSYADVLPYFRKAETNADFDDAHHGRSGPLGVETNRFRHPVHDLFFQAAAGMGLPFNPDFNGAVQEGYGRYQATQRKGRRSSTAEAYLDPVRGRANLTVLSGAQVTRIVVENSRAVAVEAVLHGREGATLRADAGIVLAAGSIGSPHIMMLSGMGPADVLARHGVDVVADLPAVGQNLEDHLSVGDCVLPVRDGVFDAPRERFDEALRRFEATGGGVLSTYYLDVGAFFSVDAGAMWPQSQMFLIPGLSEILRTDGYPNLNLIAAAGWLCRSRSRGSVTLASGNPLDPPLIDPNYLSDPDDLRLSVAQLRWHRALLASPAFDEIRAAPPQPELDSDADLADHIRRTASTIWHPSGTCRMGPGADAVVDAGLRVKGIENLWICDASVMPAIPSANINAATIMVAEKGADLIRGNEKTAPR